jgi:hypothetical protein
MNFIFASLTKRADPAVKKDGILRDAGISREEWLSFAYADPMLMSD